MSADADHDLSNPNVIRGLQSTLKNPRVGEEAKAHAQELLDSTKTDSKMSDTGPTGSSSLAKNGSAKEAAPVDDDNTGEIAGHGETNRVLGGYKATLKNPNVSEEAKEHAREVLEEHGMEVKE